MTQTQLQVDYDTDRRQFERTNIAVFGRCLLPNQLEIPCQAINISPGDVGLIAAHAPLLADSIIIYLDHIGRLEGEVARLYEGGFSMTLRCTARKREKLEARIEWLKAHRDFQLEDNRQYERVEPNNKNSELRLNDGRAYPIEIIDISLSGTAVSCNVKPAIGSDVWVAGMQGKVVRHFVEGIAVEFESTSHRSGLFVDTGLQSAS